MRQQACAAIACLFALGAGAAAGQSPDFTAAETGLINAMSALIDAGTYPEEILDIVLLCPVVLARPVGALVPSLENEGWAFNLFGMESANPFYTTHEGRRAYGDDYAGELYLGYQYFPTGEVNYCAFTYFGSTKHVPLTPLAEVFDAELAITNAHEHYASWALTLDGRDYFARADLSAGRVYVQYTTFSHD